MRKMVLTRIGIWSAVTRISLGMTVCGFVLGILVSLWAAVLASSFTVMTGIDVTGLGFALLVLLPLIGAVAMGVTGVVTTFLFVAVFNLIAGKFGGIEVEYDEKKDEGRFEMYGDL
ncbi:hypothetical protein ACFL5H_01755 [Candidatus Latescibacterota bacterium]